MKGLADKGEREEKRRNEGKKGLGDMNPLTHITITQRQRPCSVPAPASGSSGSAPRGRRGGVNRLYARYATGVHTLRVQLFTVGTTSGVRVTVDFICTQRYRSAGAGRKMASP